MAGAAVTPVSQANLATFKRLLSDNSKLIEHHQSFPNQHPSSRQLITEIVPW
jgi:hypothetical protein